MVSARQFDLLGQHALDHDAIGCDVRPTRRRLRLCDAWYTNVIGRPPVIHVRLKPGESLVFGEGVILIKASGEVIGWLRPGDTAVTSNAPRTPAIVGFMPVWLPGLAGG